MADLRRTFVAGRMNKDLDERLVPGGEYRDAMNIEVSTSENSDMGAVQSVMGNSQISLNFFAQQIGLGLQLSPTAICVGEIVDEKNDKLYWLVCDSVGTTGSNGVPKKDLIIEYDNVTGAVLPVVVDIWHDGISTQWPRALNFNPQFPITGINVIDDFLFWTDNNSEPKKINITKSLSGSVHPHSSINNIGTPSFSVHTNYTTIDPTIPSRLWLGSAGASSRRLKEEHITVIKEAPLLTPSLQMKNIASRTAETGEILNWWSTQPLGTGPDNGAWGVNPFFDANGDAQPELWIFYGGVNVMGGPQAFTFPLNPTYNVNDIVTITNTNPVVAGEPEEIRVRILEGPNLEYGGYRVEVLYMHPYIVLGSMGPYTSTLEEASAYYEHKFARFATRYKYDDGEYSAFSPFSEPAFLPGEFDYKPKEAYNLGMSNDLKYFGIYDFVGNNNLIPDGVISIDILYKESDSPNIYIVKTITRNDKEWTDRWDFLSDDVGGTSIYTGVKGYLKIESEQIHAALPSNQYLRPWDNVPRMALSQEISGNRLIYGNYLQNYDFTFLNTSTGELELIKPNLEIKIKSRDLGDILAEQHHAENAHQYYPAKSLKTLRTYQLGIVYIDRYGRQTPVFSDGESGLSSVYLEKTFSHQANQLQVTAKHNPPNWAESFKFFIKETSNEYYNLSMDRWYNAEDGNVWLSFPSAERNKVDEDTYLILKKNHNSDIPINSPAKYKVIAIENEAPDFIKQVYQGLGKHTDLSQCAAFPCTTYSGFSDGTNDSMFGDPVTGIGWPRSGLAYFYLDEVNAWNGTGWDTSIFGSGKTDLYLRFGNGQLTSKWYKMSSVAKAGTGIIRIDIVEKFGVDVDAITNTSNGSPVSTSTVVVSASNFLEIRELIVDKNRPEFDGRFFVKILKDNIFSNTIGVGGNIVTDNLATIFERSVKYIDSYNAWSHYGESFYDFIGNSDRGYWDGYGITNRNLTSTYDLDTWTTASGIGFSPTAGEYRHFFNASREQTGDMMKAANGGTDQWGMHATARADWGKNWNLTWNTWGPWDQGVWPAFEAPRYAASENVLGKINTATYTSGSSTPNIQEFRGGGEHFWRSFCKWNANENRGKAHWFIDKRPRFYEMSQIRHASNILGEAGMRGSDADDRLWASPWPTGLPNKINTLDNYADVWYGYEDQTYGMLDPVVSPISGISGHVHTVAMKPPTSVTGGSQPWPPQPWSYLNMGYNAPTFHGGQIGSRAPYNRDPAWLGNTSFANGLDGPDVLQSYSQGIYDSGSGAGVDTIDLSAVIPGGPDDSFPRKSSGLLENVFDRWGYMKAWEGTHGEYVFDIAFINRLTTPGTLWKWAQDPHLNSNLEKVGHIYKTKEFLDSNGHIANFNQRIALKTFQPGQNSHMLGGYHELVDEVFYVGASVYYSYNKAARWRFRARLASDINVGLGQTPQTFGPLAGTGGCYLPTNDPRWIEGNTTDASNPWGVQLTGAAAPSSPTFGMIFNPLGAAPGIRSDGMNNGSLLTVAPATGGTYDVVGGPVDPLADPNTHIEQHWPGEVTWLILEAQVDEEAHQPQSTNPAIWETEPKEHAELDIYHEVSQVYPINLNFRTSELYIPRGSTVSCYRPISSTWGPPFGDITLGDPTLYTSPMRVDTVFGNTIFTVDSTPSGVQMPGTPAPPPGPHNFNLDPGLNPNENILPGDILTFTHPDGSTTSAEAINMAINANWYRLNSAVHNMEMTLPWFNCWTFGNGVESDRIRDDYNTVRLDKGPRVSTTLEDIELGGGSYKYKEERRGSGLIYSGIFNSTSGVNNLNQFVMAEKVTKDLNPTYGTIQKLFSRNTDLITLCEDKVLKVLANKDAMFNADGNINVTSNLNVLGQAMTFSGDYGISKDPTSFASESFRAYFTDKNRGVVLRLSQDGLTPISEYGMKDWFSDNLKNTSKIIGSFDEKKTTYNVSLESLEKTVSFSERSKGWVSFKSFVPEIGTSFNNEYYTIKSGHLWKHHSNPLHHNYYGSIYDGLGKLSISSIKLLFNSSPEIVKSFNTLDYEGSQARITQDIATYAPPIFGDGEYYDNFDTSGGYIPGFAGKLGWYVDSLTTNLQQVQNLEFKDKEGKWFSTIKGEVTNLGNLDTNEFSVQGIGNAIGITNTPICGCQDNNIIWPGTVMNYDPAADHDCACLIPATVNDMDYSCCVYCDMGCTDPTAYNYDSSAGCYTVSMFVPFTHTFNGSYSADDGSCQYCSEPTIDNLTVTNATIDIASCAPNADGTFDFIPISTIGACNQLDINIADSGGISVFSEIGVTAGVLLSQWLTNSTLPQIVLPSGVYTVTIYHSFTCGLAIFNCPPYIFEVTINSDNIQSGCMDNGIMDNTPVTGYANNQLVTPFNNGWGSFIPGFAASNYDPFAICDDGTCLYPVIGCTDPYAFNYDPAAVIDDGTCSYCQFVPDGDFGYQTFLDTGNYLASPSATTGINVMQHNHAGQPSNPTGQKTCSTGANCPPAFPNMMTGQVWPPAVQTYPEAWKYRHPAWDNHPSSSGGVLTHEWTSYYSDDCMIWFFDPNPAGSNFPSNGVDLNWYTPPPPIWDNTAIANLNTVTGSTWQDRPGIILELHGARPDGVGGIVPGSVNTAGGPAQNQMWTAGGWGFSFDPNRFSNAYSGIHQVVTGMDPGTCYKVEVTVQRLPVDTSSASLATADPVWYDASLGGNNPSAHFGMLSLEAGPTMTSHYIGHTSYPAQGWGTDLEPFFADTTYYGSPSNCNPGNLGGSITPNINWQQGPSVVQGPTTYTQEFTSNQNGEGYLGLRFQHMNFAGGGAGYIPVADKIIITNVCISKANSGVTVDPECSNAPSGGACCTGPGTGACDPNSICGFPCNTCEDVANNYGCTQGDTSCYCCAGCTVSGAYNYDSFATCDDGSCFACIYGCMDDGNRGQSYWNGTAIPNYHDYATQYGLATYPGGANLSNSGWYTGGQALNYDPNATCDDGSCLYNPISGCINDTHGPNPDIHGNCHGSMPCSTPGCCLGTNGYNAYNYNPWATIDDGSCGGVPSPQCMDPYACNFVSTATQDCIGANPTPDYSLGLAPINGGTNATFGDTGCCDYDDAIKPGVTPLSSANWIGGPSSGLYTIQSYYNQPFSSAMREYDDATVQFDTVNRTVTFTPVHWPCSTTFWGCHPLADGNNGNPITYYYRHCDQCTNATGVSGAKFIEIFSDESQGTPIWTGASGVSNSCQDNYTLNYWDRRFWRFDYNWAAGWETQQFTMPNLFPVNSWYYKHVLCSGGYCY